MAMKRFFYPLVTFVLLFLLLVPAAPSVAKPPATGPQDVFIGVLAKRSPAICIKRWQPLADYLNEHIWGKRFYIVALPFDQVIIEVEVRVASNSVRQG